MSPTIRSPGFRPASEPRQGLTPISERHNGSSTDQGIAAETRGRGNGTIRIRRAAEAQIPVCTLTSVVMTVLEPTDRESSTFAKAAWSAAREAYAGGVPYRWEACPYWPSWRNKTPGTGAVPIRLPRPAQVDFEWQ